jgi:REP element-mobilizing transposase RayT
VACLAGFIMVIASHVIFGAYGFWLPNDPRGSWSTFIGSFDLFLAGNKATKVSTRRSVAAVPHDVARRLATKSSLQRHSVRLTGQQAVVIGRAFGDFAQRNEVSILACAIMPDHVHLVLGRHRYRVEQLASLLKGAASRRLVDSGLHPFQEDDQSQRRIPTCWARGEWKVFLDSTADVKRAIRYVEMNPVRQGMKPQYWSFVAPGTRGPLP